MAVLSRPAVLLQMREDSSGYYAKNRRLCNDCYSAALTAWYLYTLAYFRHLTNCLLHLPLRCFSFWLHFAPSVLLPVHAPPLALSFSVCLALSFVSSGQAAVNPTPAFLGARQTSAVVSLVGFTTTELSVCTFFSFKVVVRKWKLVRSGFAEVLLVNNKVAAIWTRLTSPRGYRHDVY